MLEITNKVAYCCKCVCRKDGNVIYSQMYIKFRGTELGFMLHLDVMIAKNENYFVYSCITCIAVFVESCLTLEYLFFGSVMLVFELHYRKRKNYKNSLIICKNLCHFRIDYKKNNKNV